MGESTAPFFFDDTQPHNLIANDTVKFIVVSIAKSNLGSRLSSLSKILDHRIYDYDTDARLTWSQMKRRILPSISL